MCNGTIPTISSKTHVVKDLHVDEAFVLIIK